LTGYFPQTEKKSLLKNADMFVFPSFYEGFGIPILEAQASGIPVVTSDVSSMPEVAGKGALFIDPDSPTQIAEAIYKIISEPAVRNNLIASGQENLKNFSWEKCARETLNAIISSSP
jgi:glycosyltransferase involved in cell wall biosynthesis